jgi:single-strand DNA-binding protein
MAKLYGLMRLGRDAEIRTTPNGEKVANLSLVYSYGRKDSNGEMPSQWIDAAFWGERAEKLAPFLKKGAQHLFTLSDVHVEKYTGKDGFEAFKLAGRVDDVELTPRPRDSQQEAAPQRRPAQQATQAQPPTNSGFDDMPDDIPF